ncbi:hypothetical protein ACFX1Q_025176 [Malus domestica]
MVITILNKKKKGYLSSLSSPLRRSSLPYPRSLFSFTQRSCRPAVTNDRQMISPESLSVLFPNHRYGSGIQDDEDRSWSGDDGCDEARAGDEVDRAGGCSASFGYFRIFNLDFTLLQFDLGFFFVVLLF